MPRPPRSSLAALAVLVLPLACAGPGQPDDDGCTGAKCDTPDESTELSCEKRRSEALESGQRAFVEEAIRWSCADVAGVDTNRSDDRGQEYCEYYAIVEPPGAAKAVTGKLLAETDDGPVTTPLGVELADAQIEALEDAPDAIVGQCVFHSWHSDVFMDVPACAGAACPEIMGYRLDATETFRVDDRAFEAPMFKMALSVNSNSAARLLAADCLKPGPEATADDYARGCEMCGDLFDEGLCVPWRKSDPTICAGVMRLAECGCALVGGGDVAENLVPLSRRGFPLGTWSGVADLPPGCRHVDPGDGSQTIVTCDLTGADLLASANDPKGVCRSKYADNVVVHIPIPDGAVTCTPPEGETCSATPWVLEPEM